MSHAISIELRDEERTRCEVWTRVMGYHRPVAAFNPGKRSEHHERLYFVERGSETGEDPIRIRSCNTHRM
jgi:hypothetical protein